MAYWLMKSEPDSWSWDQQVKKGRDAWTGVRNHQAANNLRAMRHGDQAFFYHSNVGKEIVGIVEIVGEARPDPDDARFAVVDVAPVRALPSAVTLEAIKGRPELAGMALLHQARLSVQPVKGGEWDIVLEMSEAPAGR